MGVTGRGERAVPNVFPNANLHVLDNALSLAAEWRLYWRAPPRKYIPFSKHDSRFAAGNQAAFAGGGLAFCVVWGRRIFAWPVTPIQPLRGGGSSCICGRRACFLWCLGDGAFLQGLSRPYSRHSAARARMFLRQGGTCGSGRLAYANGKPPD